MNTTVSPPSSSTAGRPEDSTMPPIGGKSDQNAAAAPDATDSDKGEKTDAPVAEKTTNDEKGEKKGMVVDATMTKMARGVRCPSSSSSCCWLTNLLSSFREPAFVKSRRGCFSCGRGDKRGGRRNERYREQEE